jgi:hypothetical protein
LHGRFILSSLEVQEAVVTLQRQLRQNIHVRRFFSNYLIQGLRREYQSLEGEEVAPQTWIPQLYTQLEGEGTFTHLKLPPQVDFFVLLIDVSFYGRYVGIPSPSGQVKATEATLRLDSRKYQRTKQYLAQRGFTVCKNCQTQAPTQVKPHTSCELGWMLAQRTSVFIENGDQMRVNGRQGYKHNHGAIAEELMKAVDVLPVRYY